MSPKSLIRHTFTTLLGIFHTFGDAVAVLVRPILIRIYHYDNIKDVRGLPPRDFVELVFSYYDTGVTHGTPDDTILERQFELFNIGTTGIARRYRDKRLRSLSVEDRVGIQNRYYRCDSRGWTRIPAPA
ncbi:hypothetical protein IU450_36070 [Nocardia abscessus]|uniref:hypothetical protein n=1 Tax=Nocardia abscessus TaxID=120957 RepID=UPI00189533E9|nr:hypothetical protein [Nocardia abscessus]MBF6341259.1 hypothetical protein [Nocardia abscessus]